MKPEVRVHRFFGLIATCLRIVQVAGECLPGLRAHSFLRPWRILPLAIYKLLKANSVTRCAEFLTSTL